jgi:hypothetical protein
MANGIDLNMTPCKYVPKETNEKNVESVFYVSFMVTTKKKNEEKKNKR